MRTTVKIFAATAMMIMALCLATGCGRKTNSTAENSTTASTSATTETTTEETTSATTTTTTTKKSETGTRSTTTTTTRSTDGSSTRATGTSESRRGAASSEAGRAADTTPGGSSGTAPRNSEGTSARTARTTTTTTTRATTTVTTTTTTVTTTVTTTEEPVQTWHYVAKERTDPVVDINSTITGWGGCLDVCFTYNGRFYADEAFSILGFVPEYKTPSSLVYRNGSDRITLTAYGFPGEEETVTSQITWEHDGEITTWNDRDYVSMVGLYYIDDPTATYYIQTPYIFTKELLLHYCPNGFALTDSVYVTPDQYTDVWA